MAILPEIRESSGVGTPHEIAARVTAAVSRGEIVRIRLPNYSSTDIVELASHLGEIFEPVALPPGRPLNAVTEIYANGRVVEATNWHFDQSFAGLPPEWSLLYAVDAPASTAPTV